MGTTAMATTSNNIHPEPPPSALSPGTAVENLRRMADIVIALVGLLLFVPILPILALAIWWHDGFPIFFFQTRVGRLGRPFRIVKLRSMRQVSGGSLITAQGDVRTTPMGRWMRKYKFDEVPQLWNVLTGEMSLIGPRPEVSRYVDLTDPLWQEVLDVRPGITDLATLAYRDEEHLLAQAADPEVEYRTRILGDKLKLNLSYIRHRTLLSDCRLLWLTCRFSLVRGGFDADRIRRIIAQ